MRKKVMKRFSIAICCLVALLSVAASSDEKTEVKTLSVRIVPTRISKKSGRSISLWQPSQHFHVIISMSSFPCHHFQYVRQAHPVVA